MSSTDKTLAARARNLLGLISRPRPEVGATPADVVHRENKWRLLRYRGAADGARFRRPVLLVPSLINRHYVLDLMPGKSFAESMINRGHDVFMIDWGTPGPEDRYLSFDDYAGRYVGRAIERTARASGAEAVHLLGYCLGGLLTTVHCCVESKRIASMALLAAPIDFHDGSTMSRWVRDGNFSVDALTSAFGNVPWPLLQASFQLLKPTMPLRKAIGLLDRAWDDQFLDGFFAIERWGNDNVSFPGQCYREYIDRFYKRNLLVGGQLVSRGKPAVLEAIDCPLFVVTFEHDHIVPAAGAAVILERVASTDITHLHLDGGHVGAVVSRRASKTLWPQLSAWWADRDANGSAAEREHEREQGDLSLH